MTTSQSEDCLYHYPALFVRACLCIEDCWYIVITHCVYSLRYMPGGSIECQHDTFLTPRDMIVRALAATYAEGYPLTARRHADSRSLSVTLRGSVNAYRPDGLFGETLCNAHFRLVRTARPFSCVCNSRITVVLFLGQRLNVWSMCLIFGS
jgi:hypothetical protein